MSSKKDDDTAIALAILAGVVFRKYATNSGPHYFIEAGVDAPSFGSVHMKPRSKARAAREWLAKQEERYGRRDDH